MRDTIKLKDQKGIRESMLRFPKWTQHFFTWYTGKALPGQEPLYRMPAVCYALINVLLLVAFIIMNMLLVYYQPFAWGLWLVIGWILSVSCMRVASTVVAHHCVHKRVSGNSKIDRLIAHVLSLILCTENPDDYYHDHLKLHHNQKAFATEEDPTVIHLRFLGFKPGMSYRRLWLQLFMTLVSPKFHFQFLWMRIKTTFYTSKLAHKIIATVYVVAVGFIMVHYSLYSVIILGLLVPLLPLYHISALLEFLSEHAWFKSDMSRDKHSRLHADYSWGRFCGDKLPEKNQSKLKAIFAWSVWYARAIFYHLPARLTIVPGDLAQHDYHHRHVKYDWPWAAYARQADIDNKPADLPDYSEVWGIVNAVRQVFSIISNQ